MHSGYMFILYVYYTVTLEAFKLGLLNDRRVLSRDTRLTRLKGGVGYICIYIKAI